MGGVGVVDCVDRIGCMSVVCVVYVVSIAAAVCVDVVTGVAVRATFSCAYCYVVVYVAVDVAGVVVVATNDVDGFVIVIYYVG